MIGSVKCETSGSNRKYYHSNMMILITDILGGGVVTIFVTIVADIWLYPNPGQHPGTS